MGVVQKEGHGLVGNRYEHGGSGFRLNSALLSRAEARILYCDVSLTQHRPLVPLHLCVAIIQLLWYNAPTFGKGSTLHGLTLVAMWTGCRRLKKAE